jgi:hypothetical protein
MNEVSRYLGEAQRSDLAEGQWLKRSRDVDHTGESSNARPPLYSSFHRQWVATEGV